MSISWPRMRGHEISYFLENGKAAREDCGGFAAFIDCRSTSLTTMLIAIYINPTQPFRDQPALGFIEEMIMFSKYLKEEDGGQVVEYALIIAMVSIALVLALKPQMIGASFANFIDRVQACLTATPCV